MAHHVAFVDDDWSITVGIHCTMHFEELRGLKYLPKVFCLPHFSTYLVKIKSSLSMFHKDIITKHK